MQWSDVRARLALKEGDHRVFGAGRHGWRLEPPLSADELASLEAQLGVTLPADYRAFLLEAGAGGAGPYYGLFPVRRVDGRWRWEPIGDANFTDFDHLNRPFGHTAAVNPQDLVPPPPREDDFATEDAYFDAVVEHGRREIAEVERPEHTWGLLWLCHEGCGYRYGVVVTGPARGQMWFDATAADLGYRPLTGDDGAPLTFTRWYRDWLDAV